MIPIKCGRNEKLSVFLVVCDLHPPLRTKHVRASKSPWTTPELNNLMCRRGRLKIKALRRGDPSDWDNFTKLRNGMNIAIKSVKKSYYNKAFETHNGNRVRHGKLSMR